MATPSEAIVAAAAETMVVRDGAGRALTVRRPGALDRLRMFKALGPELAQNACYLGMAMLAVSVLAIDDVPVPRPVNEGQLESLVQRLGEAGLAAIADALEEPEISDPGN